MKAILVRAAGLWAALMAAALAAPAQGQVRVGAADVDGINTDSRDSQQGVTVRDSPEALKKLDTARNMERQHDWNKAAGWYQEVIEQYRDRVVPSHVDRNNVIDQYTSITTTVQEALAKWPAEGLAAYRARYEAQAQELLQQAGQEDYDALNSVFQTYFVTDAAKTAGLRLIDLYMEEGDFSAAAWLGDRLLTWHPDLTVERPAVLYRTALAYHLCGDEKRGQARLGELEGQFPKTAGTIFGKDVILAEELKGRMAMERPVVTAMTADSWPMLGGDPSRSRISDGGGRPGAMAWSVEFSAGPVVVAAAPRGPGEPEVQDDETVRAGRAPGVMPVADGGAIYFQDGQRLYALSLETGLPLPGWLQTYGGEAHGLYALAPAGSPDQQTTVTVAGDSVLTVTGATWGRNMGRIFNRAMMVPGPAQRQTRLICLDRHTGRLRWAISPGQLKDDLAWLEFSGSPLVVGNNVYIMGRGGKNFQYEDCYILCFDLEHGLDVQTQKPRWSCCIASALNVGNMWMEGAGGGPMAAVSHPAYAGGRLYVLSNLGALAAVDAYNGTVVWLSLYPRRDAGDLNMAMNGIARPSFQKPWEANPVFVEDSRVFVLPSDSRFIFVYDAGTGAELQRIDCGDFFERGQIKMLLAVAGENITVATEKAVMSLHWPEYQSGHDRAVNCVQWAGADMQICGRPFVTTDSVFVPAQDKLHQIQATGTHAGYVTSSYPTYGHTWDYPKEGPGNVLVTSEYVAVAGANGINVYTDMDVARAKLDREVSANPRSADPRLHYAELMFSAGDLGQTIKKLDEAIGLLGGMGSLERGPERERLYNDTLLFAEKLVRDKSGPSNDLAERFFDIAAAAADTPGQQVNYRRLRASFARDVNEFDTAVRLYQSILSQPEMRSIAWADAESGTTLQAAAAAEQAINQIIRTHPDVYTHIEAEAIAALEAARASKDPDRILAVAESYPNSDKVYTTALLAAAETYEALGKPRQATDVLRRAYLHGGEMAGGAALVEAMVRNYLARPDGLEIALGRLERATATPLASTALSRPLKLPDGSVLEHATFLDAYRAVSKLASETPGATLPDFHLPARLTEAVHKAGGHVLREDPPGGLPADVLALVVAPPDLREMARFDRVVTWSEQGLGVYGVGESQPLWHGKALGGTPTGLAWIGPQHQRLLIWSGTELAMIRPQPADAADAAATRADASWRSGLASMPAVDIVSGGATEPVAVVGNTDGGIIDANGVRIQVRNGQAVMIQRGAIVINGPGGMVPAPAAAPAAEVVLPADEQIRQVRPLDDRVVVATNTGRIFCNDLASGRMLWQTRLSGYAVERLLANSDFTVAWLVDGNNVQYAVLDNSDGRLVSRRGFTTDPSGLNMALGADGLLVWTMGDRICGKDLYEPGEALRFQDIGVGRPVGQALAPMYQGCNRPDQLVIAQDRIIALSDQGTMVALRSTQTGQILHQDTDNGPEAPLLKTKASNTDANANVWLRTAGSYLYVVGTRSLMAYNMDNIADDSWEGDQRSDIKPHIVDAFIGRNDLLLVDEAFGAANNIPTALLLCSYSRRHVPDTQHPGQFIESGLPVDDCYVVNPAGIVQLQPVEGGVCYLSGDHKLHLLRGIGE